jgi:leucyl aminopeptidase (aminopeptidase T)
MPDLAHTITLDPQLQPGARNAIRDCLRLRRDERITIITDEVTREIAVALQAEVEEVGAEHAIFILEEQAERPLTDMPEVILSDLALSQVSIFCAQTQRGELRSRMQMSDVVNRNRIRHGHGEH